MKPLRVLHIGNIANNAYNIAKALRQRTDIEADSFSHGFLHYISHPQWEDADIDPPRFGEYGAPDWSAVDLKGFESPDWHFINFDGRARQRNAQLPLKTLTRTITLSARHLPDIERLATELPRSGRRSDRKLLKALSDIYAGLAADWPETFTQKQWHKYLLTEYRRLLGGTLTPLTQADINEFVQRGRHLEELFRSYDIIQAYGVWEPMYPMLLAPSIPRITFEHGSMREHPFHNSPAGRLLALAYKTSERNIITNADSIHAIRRLGLDNCTFIPHPVDDKKFQPRSTPLREQLLREHDCTRILFSPTRHNWQVKGNDTIIRAFAHRLATHGRGDKLFLADWGQEMDRSKELASELGVSDSIVWLPPLPKRRLADMLNASDVVLDQFVLGAFGTVTPEALACGVPVILYYKREDHDWCFPVHPPVLNARTVEEVAGAIDAVLDDDERRKEIAQQGRAWYLEHHSIDVVVRRNVEIYNAIRKSPCVAGISPNAYKETAMVNARVLAVVRSRVALGAQGKPKYLREVAGRSIMQILAGRLDAIPKIAKVVLVMDEHEPATASAARKLGWTVVLKHRPRVYNPLTLLGMSRCTHLALFDLDFPFVDPELFDDLLVKACTRRLDSARVEPRSCYGPSWIIRRRLAFRAVMLKLLMHGSFAPWRKVFDTAMDFGSHGVLAPQADAPLIELTSESVTTHTIEALGGCDFSFEELRRLETDPDRQRRMLLDEMIRSESPHLVNAQLNDLERRLDIEEMTAFPTFVGLNMTSVCNARCIFCSYQPAQQKRRDFVTLDDIRKMTWLRYVRDLAIWGGIGDSLVNPAFLDCYRYIKRTFGHLNVSFSTNGIAMNEEICEEFLGHLGSYNVSLNAATRETWETLMRARGFENVCKTFSYLAEQKRRRGLDRPSLALSMVLTRDNVSETIAFAELAHKLGAERVTYVHYVPSTLVGRRDLPPERSLYFDKDRADALLDAAAERACELGLQVDRPLPFRKKNAKICMGTRVDYDPQPCMDPWRTCYLTVDEDGRRQMIFCCSGFYYDIDYDVTNLTEENFRMIWNHPTARYFRRTVHGNNPICTYCRTEDRFDPNGRMIYRVAEKIAPIFRRISQKVGDGTLTNDEAMLEHGELAAADFTEP